jgi:hypothetical protein
MQARRRRLVHEPLEARDLLAFGDVVMDYKFVNSGGTPVTSLQVGQDFTLQVYVRDGQAVPEGVLRAYLDFTYPAALATVQGPITHGANFNLSTEGGDASTPGLIDEVGGLDSDAVPPSNPGDSFLLFSLPMRAASPGTLTLTADPAEGPTRRVQLFDSSTVSLSDIRFVNSSIQIVGAGITVTPTSGLTTTELGGTAQFSIVLTTQPTDNVTIGLSSNDLTEGTVSPTSLTFTTANWNTPRSVTVTGVNDDVDDGNVLYTIETASAVSTDTRFSGLNPSDVTVTNTNDDIARIDVTATQPLTTNETGTTATFQIVLKSQPTANVTIPISSSDTTEGTVLPSSVVFTPQNWNVARTVTVTGIDDPVADGDINYTIRIGAATSSDPKYNGLDPADLAAVNRDPDVPGFTVQPTSGLQTTEAGGTATFQIRLNTQPTANVTIPISSSDTTEGTVSPTSVTFTPANWSASQTVTVTGVNDNLVDGSILYQIVTGAAVSADGKYNGLDPANVTVVNIDVPRAEFEIVPTSGLMTTELGGTTAFTVRLFNQPAANVTLPLTSSDTTEGTVSPSALTFTTANWNVTQTVTITGVNDNVSDGNVPYSIITGPATSTDAAYNGVNPTDVSVTNIDDDPVGITVNPTSGLVTKEKGDTASFTIKLTSEPTANVTIPISSNNTAEGTVTPSSLTFTIQNWNQLQTVTVRGVDDLRDDGDRLYTIVTGAAVSTDSKYSGLNADDVSVTNLNDDRAEIMVTAPATLTTSEERTTDSFQIVLKSEPTANVTIPISSSDTTEGTVSPSSVVFTPQNWNVARTVTVTGIDDPVADGDINYTIRIEAATSSDPKYNGLDPNDLAAKNLDFGDTPGFTVLPTSGLQTTEVGGTATFQIRLNTQPTANVTIPISSSDTTEGTVVPSSVTFTPANWNTSQTVTVTGVNDDLSDGNVVYTIITGAATGAAGYAGLNPDDVSVTNFDDDPPGFTIVPTSGLVTSEAGQTATFTIRLNSQPTANVTIPLSTSDATEGTVSPTSVTFTPQNWNVNRPITVTGVDDDLADGSIFYEIITGVAVSSDTIYNGLNPVNVSATNTDNDPAEFVIVPTSGLTTTEIGGMASFTVRLRSRPAANVTLPLSSSDLTEGTVSSSALIFTATNYNVAQTVTITGVNDNVSDGNVPYSIITGPATSTDAAYNGVNPIDVSVTNIDDDPVGITVNPTSGLVTKEKGDTASFTVKLTSEPTANVTIPLSSNNTSEGTVTPSSLTYTSQNWNQLQTVTVRGIDDFRDDGDRLYTIVTGAAVSTDSKYSGLNADDVSVTNLNDDFAEIAVTAPATLTTSETRTTATFQIVLKSEPTANVTIPISSSDTSEGIVSVSSLVFTPQNWNVVRTVTVTGVDDLLLDGPVNYFFVLGAATSSDTKYNGLDPLDLPAVNLDDDVPGFFIQPTTALTTTEAAGLDHTKTFQIRLTVQPNANVSIGLSSSDTTEGTVSPTSLMFTPTNWNTLQTVTVTGVDDNLVDGNVTYAIITAAATGDAAYAGLDPPNVSVTNIDDDIPGFVIAPTAGLVTSEAGLKATFTIRLQTQPTADVTLPLSTSNPAEATVSHASVKFTPQNWNVNQPITVTGVNDDIDDDTVAYEIITGTAVSTDVSYSGLDPVNVSASNNDDTDTASMVVAPTSALTTTELGGTASFTVRLGSQPTANVQIQLSSSDTTEGTVSPSVLTFTPANWKVDRNVTVTGVNDNVHDGPIGYTIAVAATSADVKYNSLSPQSVVVTNSDDDPVGVLVTPTSGLTTTEAGGTAQFTVRLLSEPTANVTIPLSSSNTEEGTVSPASLTFTNQNWNVLRTVTVTGVSDFRADGDIAYQIVTALAVSADADYNGFDAADVAVTNVNTGPAPGYTITPVTGLTVLEDGPTAATFQVRLTSQPTANVLVTYMSSDTTEGTVSSVPVTFTEQNWNLPQTVTINGVDDPQADGDVTFTIRAAAVTSQDPVYNGLLPAEVSVTNIDDDPTAIIVSPTAGLQTSESGTTASFSLKLASQPTADVTVSLASSNASEGIVSPESVTFTADNWDTLQTVTITGVDDETVDGNVSYMIVTALAVSADPNYDGFDAPDVSATNLDDDTATLTLSAMTASQAEGTGGGLTDFVFQLELSRAVAGGFNVGYTTNDGTATAADGDYIDNDGVLTFEGAKCEIRTITVQVNQDNQVEADETFDVAVGQLTNIAANLAERITFITARVGATIANDDTAKLLLSPVATVLQEGTGPATTLFGFNVTLSAPVQGGLSVSYSTDDATATLADGDYIDNDGVLTFTGAANEQKTINVAVNQDDHVEADEAFTVALRQLSNIDPSLAASISIDGSPATATIANDDTATLTITSVTPSQQEGSDGATTDYRFEVTLSKAVQGGFTIAYTTDDGTATLADGDYVDNDGSLTFVGTAGEVQTITVRVNQDLQIEPDEAFQLALGQLSGTSATIASSVTINGSPVTATILNDDVPRLVLAAAASTLQEGTTGSSAVFTFTVTLSDDIDDPDGFDVAFATSDGTATATSGDYTANSGLLHFTGTAGETKTFMVEVLPDSIVEANETFQLALGDVEGLEPGITINKVGTPVIATIQNDDTTTIGISPLSAAGDEGTGATGIEHAFVVTLSNPVQGGVRIDFATMDGTATVADGDYVANVGTLTFNGNANETQTVTVIVSPDSKVEADEMLQLMLGALDVADTEIANSITLGDSASITIINDDTAVLTLAPVAASQNEGTSGTTTDFTFQVTLSNQVQGGFTIAYNTSDGTATLADADYVDNDGTLTFVGNANETQTVTVRVNHDQKIEPNESFNVSLGAISQLAPTAADDITASGSPASATILNDDFPRLVVSANLTSQAEGTGSGNTEFIFTVTLSDPVADPDGFDVTYSTNDGTATSAGGDYSDNDGVLHFDGAAGESHTVVVQVNRDSIVEADETFAFSLDEIIGLVAGETIVFDGSPVTATILNDDATTVSVTPGTVSQNEGSGGATTAFTFNATLSNAVQGGFSIGYATVDGSATVASGDYVDNDGTLNFIGNGGETQTITVQVNQDNRVELNETFQVALGTLSLVASGIAANITVDNVAETATILNDDSTTLTVSAVAATVTEGTGSGTTDATFQVTLSNPVQGGFRIAHTTNDGTATVANADYIDNDGSLAFNGTANETKTVVVQVRRDSIVERNETFTFGLTQLSELDPILAQSVTLTGGPREVTIVNDDAATVSFVTNASSAAEASGTHTVEVVLNVNDAGSLGEAIVVNVAALPTSSAISPDDFLLLTTSVTFAAGSQTGSRRTISLTLQADDLVEGQETIDLQLSFNGQDLGEAVTLGAARHLVTVTEDPMTALIRGRVWADTNNNRLVDDNEMMIPGVTVRLSGQDLRGQIIEIETMTAADGSYTFDRLPGGTYRVVEVQPAAFHDGQEVLGTVAGTSSGQAGADQFTGIVLEPTQQASGYNFGEVSLKAQYVTNRFFLASTTQQATMLQGFVADGEARVGNEMQAAAIRNGESVEVRRIGSQVTVNGTSQRDVITFTPAQAGSGGEHTLVANGLRWTFAPATVNDFVFVGGGGNDVLRLDDSPASERLSATRDKAMVTTDDYRAEASAFELVQAISDSGGQDISMNLAQAVDFVLQLEGNWISQ